MGDKSSKNKVLIPVLTTLITAGLIFALPVTFGISSVSRLWPLVGTALFGSLALVTFTKEFWAFWSVLFFFWFLSSSGLAGLGRTWPLLLLVIAGLVYSGYRRASAGKKEESEDD